MNASEAIAALRGLQAHHSTTQGTQIGFFMQDAKTAIGNLAQASNLLAELMAAGLIESHPVVINGEVHTIYRVADATPPASNAVH